MPFPEIYTCAGKTYNCTPDDGPFDADIAGTGVRFMISHNLWEVGANWETFRLLSLF
jgi:hypothetical protein